MMETLTPMTEQLATLSPTVQMLQDKNTDVIATLDRCVDVMTDLGNEVEGLQLLRRQFEELRQKPDMSSDELCELQKKANELHEQVTALSGAAPHCLRCTP